MESVKIVLVSPNAKMPMKAENGSVGYDLFCCDDFEIPSKERATIPLGFKMEFSGDCYARIAPRSGLAYRAGIDVLAGVIDPSYRGIVKVILINLGDQSIRFTKGDRVAQMIFERVYTPSLVLADLLSDTTRGEGGFGSTG